MRVDDDRSALWTKHHISRKVKSLKKATGVRTVGSGLREVKEIYEERVGGGGGGVVRDKGGVVVEQECPALISSVALSVSAERSVSQSGLFSTCLHTAFLRPSTTAISLLTG